MRNYKLISAIFCAALLHGCSDDEVVATPDVSRPECENLNPMQCLMPWPSSRYLVEDSSTLTGRRIQLPQNAMPANQWDEIAQAEPYNRFDGFSPMTSMVTVFDGELDTGNLPGEDNIADSLLQSSPTVLLDAETGERVGHFSEINQWDGTDFARAAFYVRPAVRLEENRRYIVAIRSLKLKGGADAPVSEYFRALRDNVKTDAPEVEGRRAAFNDIFERLDKAGVPRGTLQQAWDFHTASGQTAWRDILSMRDDAMERVGARGLGCTVTNVEEQPRGDERIWRQITGTVTVPLYLDNDKPGARLNRDLEGLPAYNGTAEAPFTIVIPESVRADVEAGGAQGRLLTYGHGLMGSANEVTGSFQRQFLSEYKIIGLATDWWGMSEPDTNIVAKVLGQMGDFPKVGERLSQGVINTLVLTRSFAGVCADLPELQVAGRSVIDSDEKYYLGISQGSIMGTTVAALSQDIERFILNVGGISYPIMIVRSVDFPDYNKVIQAWYPGGKLDTDLLLVMVASFWDLAEPATFASHVIKDPLPNTPVKKVLYTIGRYDAQVPNAASDIAARTMGLKLLEPAPYTPWSVETVQSPTDSAYVIYDVGEAPTPRGSQAADEDNDTHGEIRRIPAAQRQMDAFMRPDGAVQHFCDGACDPE